MRLKNFSLTFLIAAFSCSPPNSEMDFFNAGENEFISGNYPEAVSCLTRAISLKPDFAGAYFLRANAYNNMGDYRHALEDYNRAIRYRPGYAVAFRFRGVVKMATGDTLNALHDFWIAQRLGDARAGHFLRLYKKS